MSTPATDAEKTADGSAAAWPAVLTWRAEDAPRMESVRIQLSGKRIKAAGRIIGGACDEHPAFSASYDLVTDETGATRRLSVRAAVASGERQISISRDSEGYWLVDHGGAPKRARYGGAVDVDVVWSPFFNALAIRRLGLQTATDEQLVPVVYVDLPDLAAREATLTYSSGAAGIQLISPVGSSSVTVDSDGFVLTYAGLAERI